MVPTANLRAEEIAACIHDEIRPYIELDGGRIEFLRLEDTVVHVRLFGACVSCPSSLVTLKSGVEVTVRQKFPSVTAVVLEGSGTVPLAGNLIREVEIDL